jgi:hypothetical protein
MELAPHETLKSAAKRANGSPSGAKALLDLLFSCTGLSPYPSFLAQCSNAIALL